MIKSKNGKEIVAIYDNQDKEIAEVRDNQGKLLFKNWSEMQGSLPLSFKSHAGYLKDYRIYGTSSGCGVYDSESGQYKIPVKLFNGTNQISIPVYIGSEPLYSGEYVSFSEQKIYRKIDSVLTPISAALPKIPTGKGTNFLMTDTEILPSEMVIKGKIQTMPQAELYGVKVEKNNANPYSRVSYLYHAVGFTPAGMQDSSVFSYGSWSNAFFVKNNYPVMVKYDGTEDYKLSASNHAFREDGETASDISDISYDGNAMSCFDCKIWVKMWEDDNFEYYAVSNYQLDEDYQDYPYIRANGTHADKLYYPMFKGSNANGRLRSIAGTYPHNNTTAAEEVALCSANGENWQLCDWAHRTWLNVLLLLMGKNDDTQLAYGQGCTSGGSNNASIHYGFPVNGSLMNYGQFYGYADTTKAMKVFYIENWWGTRFERCLGLWNDHGTYKVKWTPAYSVNAVEDDAISIEGVTVPSTNDFQKAMSNSYGRLCIAVGGSDSTYTCDKHFADNDLLNLACTGGASWSTKTCGAWQVSVDAEPSYAGWNFGASPYLKQPQ